MESIVTSILSVVVFAAVAQNLDKGGQESSFAVWFLLHRGCITGHRGLMMSYFLFTGILCLRATHGGILILDMIPNNPPLLMVKVYTPDSRAAGDTVYRSIYQRVN
ncbi:MAG: hypothetical protein BAJATHORv1_110022 [Candidatus Thorarchaeota archaeon]|nr:MAG: hypothetical protein BAJATHORv1_110022 [Candidatus Thorarchaeota archaeon]